METYTFDVAQYMAPERFERILRFSQDKETPCLIIDLHKIRERYATLKRNMPYAQIYYALKANPMREVAAALAEAGSGFDIASIYEADQVLELGVSPDRVSYGNTIKKAKDIRYSYEKGIRVFATDSESDLRKIAENAPRSNVLYRLMTDSAGADWPLSRKFGAHPDSVYKLVLLSKKLGLIPAGISFHVGSQQRDIGQWDDAIAACKYLFEACAQDGIELRVINLGGGFPAHYATPTQGIAMYASEITRFLKEDFEQGLPEIWVEPGRYIAGDSGVLATEIVLISKKSPSNLYSWVYLDTGKFGGLIETLDEAIKYPIYTQKTGRVCEAILAGPTCDSVDILYEQHKYLLPETIAERDRLYFFTTGAYTHSYSSVCFNGFPPLKAYVIDTDKDMA